MIKYRFIKQYRTHLPYRKIDYINCSFNENSAKKCQWFGISLQSKHSNDMLNSQLIKDFESIMVDIIKYLNLGDKWIVSHDDKDMPWFLGNTYPERLNQLRILFYAFGVSLNFKGGIAMDTEGLILMLKQFIQYPVVLLHKNLDISNSRIPIIFKLTGHATLDILSNDKGIVKKCILSINEKYDDRIKIINYK